jgi:hypothetical protein
MMTWTSTASRRANDRGGPGATACAQGLVLDRPTHWLDPVRTPAHRQYECKTCGDLSPDPYGIPEGLECSSCQQGRYADWLLKKRAEDRQVYEFLPPAKCDCGFLLPKCHAHNCTPPTQKKSANARQGKL